MTPLAYYDFGRIIFASEFPFALLVQLRSPLGNFDKIQAIIYTILTKDAKEEVVGSRNIPWL